MPRRLSAPTLSVVTATRALCSSVVVIGAALGLGTTLGTSAAAQVVNPLLAPDVAAPNLVMQGTYASDHILVQLAQGVQATIDAKGRPVLSSAVNAQLRRDSRIALAAAGVVSTRSIFVTPLKDVITARAIGLDRWVRVDLVAGTDPLVAVARLMKTAGVTRAEVDPEGGLAEIPNDTDFWFQYALANTGQVVGGVAGTIGADVKAPAAWSYTHGNPNLVIAVLDSGIDPHPELAGRILPGINVPDGNTITADECNHGTHVAGILAATGNNGAGIAGMTWNAKLLPVVVVNGCTGFESNVAAGLTWAADQDANLINMSLQFYTGSTVFLQAVQYAYAQGALIVAATGNNGNGTIAAPARWNETIAVASTDNRDARSSFSNFGAETDLCAPGTNVWSLATGSGYALKSGTSMSVPHITGAAALLWSYDATLTREEVRAHLIASAVDLGTPGNDTFFGAGRLDAAAALALVPPPFAVEDLNHDGLVNAADLAILLSAWGACVDCDGGCAADFDGDCIVGATDIAQLLSAW